MKENLSAIFFSFFVLKTVKRQTGNEGEKDGYDIQQRLLAKIYPGRLQPCARVTLQPSVDIFK